MLVETRSTSKFLAYNRNKTDTNDARGLAEVVRLGLTLTTGVRLKGIDTQRLRTKITLRHTVLEQRLALQSSLRSIFRLYGRSVRSKSKTRSDVERALADILKKDGIDLSADVWPVVDLLERLDAYLKQVDEELGRIANADPVCRRLMEVPGVGPICALSFYSAIEDPDRFTSPRDVGAYLGLTPKISQSGQMLRLGRISKMGNRLTRMHLNLAAAVLLFTTKRNNALKDWGSAIASRRGNGKARTAVARKLAVLLLSLWKSGARYEAYPKSIRDRG
jgi:transposase